MEHTNNSPKYENLANNDIITKGQDLTNLYADFYLKTALKSYDDLSQYKNKKIQVNYCKGATGDIYKTITSLIDVKHFSGLETSQGFIPFLDKASNTFILKVIGEDRKVLYDQNGNLLQSTLLASDFQRFLLRVYGTQNPDKLQSQPLETLLEKNGLSHINTPQDNKSILK